jgi:hypothetical protein
MWLVWLQQKENQHETLQIFDLGKTKKQKK